MALQSIAPTVNRGLRFKELILRRCGFIFLKSVKKESNMFHRNIDVTVI